MDEATFHQHMSELYAKQGRRPQRPCDVGLQEWKNRHRISAKLTPDHYSQLMAFCRDHGLNVNSGLREILNTYFQANA